MSVGAEADVQAQQVVGGLRFGEAGSHLCVAAIGVGRSGARQRLGVS
jgi:hypothetical protein